MLPNDMRNFRAHDYETDLFQLITADDALKFLVGVLGIAMLLDVAGLLK